MSAKILPLSSFEDKDSRDKDSCMSFETTSVASSQEYIMKDSFLVMATYVYFQKISEKIPSNWLINNFVLPSFKEHSINEADRLCIPTPQ